VTPEPEHPPVPRPDSAVPEPAAPDILSGTIHPDLFREAMTRFASGVTIVTTSSSDGSWHGFTASAFCSVSLDPPLVLVCLARSADSYETFTAASGFIINVLTNDHEELAIRFATKGADKFAGGEFRPGIVDGLPVLDDALANLKCRAHARYDGGDHTIFLGEVEYLRVSRDATPALHYAREFWSLASRQS
jgi:flavin reductase ActVB